MEDFEFGTYDLELYYSENYKDWLELRSNQFKLYPNDNQTKYRLVEALVLTKNYNQALKQLKVFHDEDPDDEDFNQLVVDALRGLNKNLDSFEWKIKPKILRLDENTEQIIIENMQSIRKRKQKFNDLYIKLMNELLFFDENELFQYLKESQRFEVEGMDYFVATITRKE
jgi:protein involved in temperature-dependent protein secretion